MSKRILILMSALALLALLLFGCSLGRGGSARITATPTKTLRPLFTATLTPVPTLTATAMPLATDTPAPTATPPPPATATPPPPPTAAPLPSDTPSSPPTDTPPPPPTNTPAPPTNTPQPKPTKTPAPPTDTPRPKVDYRVIEQRLMSKQENEAQRHIILLRVVDAAGNLLDGVVVWDPNHPQQEAVSGSKPPPYHAEYLFWDYDGYQLEVKGANSAQTKVLSTDVHKIPKEDLVAAGYCPDITSCNPDELVQHYSWYVTFQRTW